MSSASAGDKIAYTLAGAAAATGKSEKHLTRLIHAGDLRAKRDGRNFLIRSVDLQAWVDGLPDADLA